MMGKKNLAKPMVEAVLEDSVKNTDGRRIYARAMVEKQNNQYFAKLTGPQGSGILTSMSQANGLVIIPENTTGVQAGSKLKVIMLDWEEQQA